MADKIRPWSNTEITDTSKSSGFIRLPKDNNLSWLAINSRSAATIEFIQQLSMTCPTPRLWWISRIHAILLLFLSYNKIICYKSWRDYSYTITPPDSSYNPEIISVFRGWALNRTAYWEKFGHFFDPTTWCDNCYGQKFTNRKHYTMTWKHLLPLWKVCQSSQQTHGRHPCL